MRKLSPTTYFIRLLAERGKRLPLWSLRGASSDPRTRPAPTPGTR